MGDRAQTQVLSVNTRARKSEASFSVFFLCGVAVLVPSTRLNVAPNFSFILGTRLGVIFLSWGWGVCVCVCVSNWSLVTALE